MNVVDDSGGLRREADQRSLGRIRGALGIGAALIAFFTAADFLFLHVNSGAALAIRAAWVITALLSMKAMSSPSARVRAAWLYVIAVSSPLFFAGLVMARGGTSTIPFAFVIAMPLALAVLLGAGSGTIFAASFSNGVAALVMMSLAGFDTAKTLEWGFAILGSSALAVYAAWIQERYANWAFAATKGRLEVQGQLAESKLARAQAERARLVEQLVGGMAHEVNNPLAFIIANLSYLDTLVAERRLGEENPEELRDVMAETVEGARRIAAVVKKFKSLSGSTPDLGACELPAAMRDALHWVTLPAGVSLHSDVPEGLPRVFAAKDVLPNLLSQVVLSAVGAFEAGSAEGGSVHVLARTQGDVVSLTIEDDGPRVWQPANGSPLETNIADAFRGTDSGIGLALAREHVMQWGGKLSIGPNSPRGTRVELWLNIVGADAAVALPR